MSSDGDHRYAVKRERLLNAVEFRPTDRLPVQGMNGTIAAIQRITGRQDYLTNPKEVFTQAETNAPSAFQGDAFSRIRVLAEARAAWPEKFLRLHPNLGWYALPERELLAHIRRLVGQAGPQHALREPARSLAQPGAGHVAALECQRLRLKEE